MLLRISQDPRKRVAAASLLLSVGLLVLSCAIAWQRALAPLVHPGAALDDFFHGFLIGLGLTFEICAVVLLARIGAACAKL